MANNSSVVLVHGLFGWGPGELAEFPYWGTGRYVPCPLPRLEASVGPVRINANEARMKTDTAAVRATAITRTFHQGRLSTMP